MNNMLICLISLLCMCVCMCVCVCVCGGGGGGNVWSLSATYGFICCLYFSDPVLYLGELFIFFRILENCLYCFVRHL